MEVYNPAGCIETGNLHAPRLDSLSSKTICELPYGQWEDHRTFPVFRELLQKRFPDAKIIPCTEFPSFVGKEMDVIAGLVKEKGCDCVIIGNCG